MYLNTDQQNAIAQGKVLFRVRLSDEEFEKLSAFARSSKRQKSEVIRDYIKRMPDPKPDPGLQLPPE